MQDIAIDVGSGVTKLRWSEKEVAHFPSLAGRPIEGGFELSESSGCTVTFNEKTYVVGELAKKRVNPKQVFNSRDDLWFASDGYLALLYAAFAQALPTAFSGKVRLCTGLPQALYNQHKTALENLLVGAHSFRVDGTKYKVQVRKEDVVIMPQVMGLFLSRLEKDRSLQVQKVALIDVGTYTSDWTIVEGLSTLQWASGGMPIGIANVIRGLDKYLRNDLNTRCTQTAINEAIRKREILSGNDTIDLSDQIDQVVRGCAARMVDSVSKQWEGGKDAKIIVGGGGGPLFGPAIRLRMPHADVITDDEPIYSIVDGFYLYLKHRRQQQAAA